MRKNKEEQPLGILKINRDPSDRKDDIQIRAYEILVTLQEYARLLNIQQIMQLVCCKHIPNLLFHPYIPNSLLYSQNFQSSHASVYVIIL